MIDRKSSSDEVKKFDFDMRVGPLTLLELILVAVGFCVAMAVLVAATAVLPTIS